MFLQCTDGVNMDQAQTGNVKMDLYPDIHLEKIRITTKTLSPCCSVEENEEKEMWIRCRGRWLKEKKIEKLSFASYGILPIPAHLPSNFIHSPFCLNEHNTLVLFLCHYFFQQCAKPAIKCKQGCILYTMKPNSKFKLF